MASILAFLGKIGVFVPVVLAINAALSAIGTVFQSISDATGKGASPVAQMFSKICGMIKTVTDFLSANLPH
jgi:hypothetical protein